MSSTHMCKEFLDYAWKDLKAQNAKLGKTSLQRRGPFIFVMKLGKELGTSGWDLCAHENGPIKKKKRQGDKVEKKANQY